jgi:hypothetical protein
VRHAPRQQRPMSAALLALALLLTLVPLLGRRPSYLFLVARS